MPAIQASGYLRRLASESGQGVAEYGLILLLAVVAAALVVAALGGAISSLFSSIVSGL